jgi:hypothetical protein
VSEKARLPLDVDIEIDQGDSWRFPYTIKLPNLTAFGYTTTDLNGCEIEAQIRPGFRGEVAASMEIDYIDLAERKFRPWLPAEDTLDDGVEGMWDLQIVEIATGWTRTFFRGEAKLNRQITRGSP